MVVSNAVIKANRIEVGDEVYVVSTSIDNQDWIVKGTVIEVKYQDKKVVEYSILLPQVNNSTAIYSVVFFWTTRKHIFNV